MRPIDADMLIEDISREHKKEPGILFDAKTLLDLIGEQPTLKSQWIPRTEKDPDKSGYYLVCTYFYGYEEPFIAAAPYDTEKGWKYYDEKYNNITHWRSLPALPERK